MREIWKDIPGFEGIYQVSNTGLVRSLNFNLILQEAPASIGWSTFTGYIASFPSQTHAAKAIGTTVSEISEVVRGRRFSTHGFICMKRE